MVLKSFALLLGCTVYNIIYNIIYIWAPAKAHSGIKGYLGTCIHPDNKKMIFNKNN